MVAHRCVPEGARTWLTVDGIEAEDVSAGDELSAPVRAAVEAVRLELRERLGKSATNERQHPDAGDPRVA